MSEIRIDNSELIGRNLLTKIKVPGFLKKYFKSFSLFAYYDSDIIANKSILNIPFLSAVLPLAWLTGYDIVVEELDMTFKKSMDELKSEFMKMYPKIQFTTEIYADELVENKYNIIDPEAYTALLFSGGVDSTYSLITNINLRPRLIMIWGADYYPYPKHSEHWKRVISTYTKFTKKHRLIFHLIKTNIGDLLDVLRIEHDFHDLLYDGSFRSRLQHSFVLLPIVAPLSVGRFNRLLIAASCDPKRPYNRAPRAWASQPNTDKKIVWANLRVKHDGYIPRIKKISNTIKEYLKNDSLILRVCSQKKPETEKLNCSVCEKCLRTIASLILFEINPKSCGFEVDNSTFHLIKHILKKEGLTAEQREAEWESIQMMIQDEINYDLYGSEKFFKWFKVIDLKSMEKNVWIYRDLYTTLPYSISRVLDMFYRKIGINIHDNCPIRQKS